MASALRLWHHCAECNLALRSGTHSFLSALLRALLPNLSSGGWDAQNVAKKNNNLEI